MQENETGRVLTWDDFSLGFQAGDRVIDLGSPTPVEVSAVGGEMKKPSLCVKESFFVRNGIKPELSIGAKITVNGQGFDVSSAVRHPDDVVQLFLDSKG